MIQRIFLLAFLLAFGSNSYAELTNEQATVVFNKFVSDGLKYEGLLRASMVNRAVNMYLVYHVQEHWSEPLEILRRDDGDCKDFSVLKYAIFRAMGVPKSDLRITTVRIFKSALHAVTEIKLGDEWLALDNRTLVVTSIESRKDYERLYSFSP